MAGGLKHALPQDWKAKSRYAVLIANSACHGLKYHDSEYYDYIPKGYSSGIDPQEQIKEFAKLGINFYCIKIKEDTNIMYFLLSKEHAAISKTPIKLADLGTNVESFGFFIQCTVNATISNTVLGSEIASIKNALSKLKKEKGE